MSDNPQTTKSGYLGNQLMRELRLTSNLGVDQEIPLSTLGQGIIGVVLVYQEKPDGCLGHVEYEDKQ